MILNISRGSIACFARGDLLQHCIDTGLQSKDEASDGVGPTHQIAYEALQIIDELSFVARHCTGLRLLQLDAARDAGHERLRVLGQTFENADEISQRLMHFRDVGFSLVSQHLKGPQPARDVFKRHRL